MSDPEETTNQDQKDSIDALATTLAALVRRDPTGVLKISAAEMAAGVAPLLVEETDEGYEISLVPAAKGAS